MISIVSAYPDFLDLYGEYSAVKLLEKRLETGPQQVRVSTLTFGRYAELENADMIYVGAGTEDRMLSALEDLRGYAKQIREFLDRGGILEVSGSSVAIFCRSIADRRTGNRYEGLGVFDAEAEITPKRRYGELICSYGDGKKVIGAVNSSIDFKRNSGQKELFTVLWDSSKRFARGSGEGMSIGGNVYASEITGPLIVRNPHLMDEIAGKLSGGKLPECTEAWYREAWKAYEHAFGVLSAESRITQDQKG